MNVKRNDRKLPQFSEQKSSTNFHFNEEISTVNLNPLTFATNGLFFKTGRSDVFFFGAMSVQATRFSFLSFLLLSLKAINQQVDRAENQDLSERRWRTEVSECKLSDGWSLTIMKIYCLVGQRKSFPSRLIIFKVFLELPRDFKRLEGCKTS